MHDVPVLSTTLTEDRCSSVTPDNLVTLHCTFGVPATSSCSTKESLSLGLTIEGPRRAILSVTELFSSQAYKVEPIHDAPLVRTYAHNMYYSCALYCHVAVVAWTIPLV